MPITILKHVVKQAPPELLEKVIVEPTEMTDEELADLYGSLQDKCEALLNDPVFVQLKLARKELDTRISAQIEPQDGAQITGNEWLLEVGPCSINSRKVGDITKIANYMGQDFYKVAKVTIADIEKYLTPDQAAEVIVSDTGYSTSRKIAVSYLGKHT